METLVSGIYMDTIIIGTMTDELYVYLQWRFLKDCFSKYRQYCQEWISSVTDEQIKYFKEEMRRLTLNGIYKGL
jgi:hypothetical protein